MTLRSEVDRMLVESYADGTCRTLPSGLPLLRPPILPTAPEPVHQTLHLPALIRSRLGQAPAHL